jgi:hypothetical protein
VIPFRPRLDARMAEIGRLQRQPAHQLAVLDRQLEAHLHRQRPQAAPDQFDGDGVELSSDLDTVTFSQAGTQVAATATTGLDLSTGKALSVNGTQVVAARDTGWTADTGTSEKTAHATYTKGSTLTFTDPPTAAEMSALATRIGQIEQAVQDFSRGQKAIKAAITGHGLIGA